MGNPARGKFEPDVVVGIAAVAICVVLGGILGGGGHHGATGGKRLQQYWVAIRPAAIVVARRWDRGRHTNVEGALSGATEAEHPDVIPDAHQKPGVGDGFRAAGPRFVGADQMGGAAGARASSGTALRCWR